MQAQKSKSNNYFPVTNKTPPAAAAKQAAKGTPFSKGDIYKELIAAKDEDDREEESK